MESNTELVFKHWPQIVCTLALAMQLPATKDNNHPVRGDLLCLISFGINIKIQRLPPLHAH